MIAIMTNQGALEVGRSLSGGSRFLAWEAALLKENFDGESVDEVASLTSADVRLGDGRIRGRQIVHTFECTGSLPVQVSSEDGRTGVKAMAVDFDFNGQVPIEEGSGSSSGSNTGNTSLEYSAVVALARRYTKYTTVGSIKPDVNPDANPGEEPPKVHYNCGDRVWLPYSLDPQRKHAYICLTDNFEYNDILPNEDTANWMEIDTNTLVKYPGEPDCYCDTSAHKADGTTVPSDIIPFFVTSYDDPVTMANGMEWEYKVRVFLDNVVTTKLSELKYFSKGGLEVNGSLMLTFLANTAEMFRAIREKVSTAS